MSKQLVTLIGLIVSIGVIALGFFLVALPMFVQATEVDSQTATVANANAVYQAQVDSLRAQEENLDEINSSVEGLRAQIPATGQFDDVFEVIGRAADAAAVRLTSITAGSQGTFVVRTGAGTDASTVAPVPDPAATETPDAEDGASTPTTPAAPAGDGRQQVDFVIQATAADMAQATSFLDQLRAGPRLLQSLTASTTQSGAGEVTIQISALTYVDSEG